MCGSLECAAAKLKQHKKAKKKNPSTRLPHYQGIDRNLNNATSYDTTSKFTAYQLKKANQIKEKYQKVKSRFKRNDVRIRKKIYSKYGRKEKNIVQQILHNVSKQIVSRNQGIILEDIKGIRGLYRKGNGQGKKYRRMLNSWPFYELHRQLAYKAGWIGLPVLYVKAAGTSSKCAVCGIKLIPKKSTEGCGVLAAEW